MQGHKSTQLNHIAAKRAPGKKQPCLLSKSALLESNLCLANEIILLPETRIAHSGTIFCIWNLALEIILVWKDSDLSQSFLHGTQQNWMDHSKSTEDFQRQLGQSKQLYPHLFARLTPKLMRRVLFCQWLWRLSLTWKSFDLGSWVCQWFHWNYTPVFISYLFPVNTLEKILEET